MVEKQQVRTKIRRLEQIKTWQLVVLLILSGFMSATFLRLNNVGMIDRRDAVKKADVDGDETVIAKRLYDLQRFVASHMNTDPGSVPLEHSYKRAYDRALQEFEAQIASQSNNNTVAEVRAYCDAQAQQGGWGRFLASADPRYVQCINDKWNEYPSAENVNYHFQAPSTAPYYHTFVSPRWSPDFAGWSLVVTGIIALIIVVRFIILVILRILIKRKYQQI